MNPSILRFCRNFKQTFFQNFNPPESSGYIDSELETITTADTSASSEVMLEPSGTTFTENDYGLIEINESFPEDLNFDNLTDSGKIVDCASIKLRALLARVI